MPKPKIEPTLQDTDPIPFGQYKGRPMQDVPSKYLLWCFEQSWLPVKHPLVYAYIYNSWDALLEDVPDYIP